VETTTSSLRAHKGLVLPRTHVARAPDWYHSILIDATVAPYMDGARSRVPREKYSSVFAATDQGSKVDFAVPAAAQTFLAKVSEWHASWKGPLPGRSCYSNDGLPIDSVNPANRREMPYLIRYTITARRRISGTKRRMPTASAFPEPIVRRHK